MKHTNLYLVFVPYFPDDINRMIIFELILPQLFSPTWPDWYPQLHTLLYHIFYIVSIIFILNFSCFLLYTQPPNTHVNGHTRLNVCTNNQLFRVHNFQHWNSTWRIDLREVHCGAPYVQIIDRFGQVSVVHDTSISPPLIYYRDLRVFL